MIVSMDKKYTNGIGEDVHIYCTDARGTYPVITKTNGRPVTYTSGGFFISDEHDEDYDLVEVGKYDHIKLGDTCVGWDGYPDATIERGYFAGTFIDKQGKECPTMYDDGGTKWSRHNNRTTWDNLELAEFFE